MKLEMEDQKLDSNTTKSMVKHNMTLASGNSTATKANTKSIEMSPSMESTANVLNLHEGQMGDQVESQIKRDELEKTLKLSTNYKEQNTKPAINNNDSVVGERAKLKPLREVKEVGDTSSDRQQCINYTKSKLLKNCEKYTKLKFIEKSISTLSRSKNNGMRNRNVRSTYLLFKGCACVIKLQNEAIRIHMTRAIFDEGSNTSITQLYKHQFGKTTNVRTKISGWNGQPNCQMSVMGNVGDFRNVLSFSNGVKDIFVPAHARRTWNQSLFFWVNIQEDDCDSTENIQMCVCKMSRQRQVICNTLYNGVVVAVVGSSTGGIARWTRIGLEMFGVRDVVTDGDPLFVNPLYITNETTRILNENGVNKFNRTNGLNNLDGCLTSMTTSEINALREINTLRYVNRYAPNSMGLLSIFFNGTEISTIYNWHKNGTMLGLENVTKDQWNVDEMQYAKVKASLVKKRRQPSSIRSNIRGNALPGERIQMDYVYFHGINKGTAATNVHAHGGYRGGILIVDEATGWPWFTVLKRQNAELYKIALTQLLREVSRDIAHNPNAVKCTQLTFDQHKTQQSALIKTTINELNILENELNITPVLARLDSNDLAVLNRTSALLHQHAHTSLSWSGLSTMFIGHAYTYAALRFKFIPNVSNTKRGLGFSAYSIWSGFPTHFAMMPLPFGISALGHARVKSKTGAIDLVYVGIDKNGEGIYWSPLQSSFLRRKNAIHMVMQPDRNRLVHILLGKPVFMEDTLTTTSPLFNTQSVNGIVWMKDHDFRAKSYKMVYGVCDYVGSKSNAKHSSLGLIRCTCMKPFSTLADWRKHIVKTPANKHVPKTVPPKKWSTTLAATREKLKTKGVYNDNIIAQIREKHNVPSELSSYSIGLQTAPKYENNNDVTFERLDEVKDDVGDFAEHLKAVEQIHPDTLKIIKKTKKKNQKQNKNEKIIDKMKIQIEELQTLLDEKNFVQNVQNKSVDIANKITQGATEIANETIRNTTTLSTPGSDLANQRTDVSGVDSTLRREKSDRVKLSDLPADIRHIDTYYNTKHKPVTKQKQKRIRKQSKQASTTKLTRRGRTIKPTAKQKFNDKLGVNNAFRIPTIVFTGTTQSMHKVVLNNAESNSVYENTQIGNVGEIPTHLLLGFSPKRANQSTSVPAYVNVSDLSNDSFDKKLPKLVIAEDAVTANTKLNENFVNATTTTNDCDNRHYIRDNDYSPENNKNFDCFNTEAKSTPTSEAELHESVNLLEQLIMQNLPKSLSEACIDINNAHFSNKSCEKTKYVDQHKADINDMESSLNYVPNVGHRGGKLTAKKLAEINREQPIPLITEQTFHKGVYGNDLPSTIPSFQHISINELIKTKNPNWVNESGYSGDDCRDYTEPLSEINECLVKLDPAVITGLKHMSTGERKKLRNKITASNRKDFIPKNAWKALQSVFALDFVEAIQIELDAISKLGTFEYVEVPKIKQNEIISSRLMFDIKWSDTEQAIDKFKCRLICGGHLQREWNEATGRGSYDSKSCSSPVVKSSSLKAQLATAGAVDESGMVFKDVGTAFLVARLKTDGTEDIYLSLPPCCIIENDGIKLSPQVLKYAKSKKPKQIVKLVKALYGAKNSSSAFYRCLVDVITNSKEMKKFNFKVSDEDPCIFHSCTPQGSIMVTVHVDDIAALICGQKGSKVMKDNVMMSQLMIDFNEAFDKQFIQLGSTIKTQYASRPEGVQFLGTVIRQHPDGTYSMDMEERIKIACEKLDLDVTRGCPKTPYASGDSHIWREKESIPKTKEEVDATVKAINVMHPKATISNYDDVIRSFRQYTGNGIWFAETGCPHLMPIIYQLARFQTFPGIEHFIAIRRVFLYMYGTRKRRLTFGKQSINHVSPKHFKRVVSIFTDTSHGDCPITRKATGGYVIFMFGSLILIRSFRLSCVTTSTAQSEYYMMSAAAAESLYIMELYNNVVLPFVNNALNINMMTLQRIPVMVSKLSNEVVESLNAKNYPMITANEKDDKILLYGDNASALLMSNSGPGKNSKHSMIKASWIWECIHIRKIMETLKVHTKCNPADICTKIGLSAEVFERHVSTILGENQVLDVNINNFAVAQIFRNSYGTPDMVCTIQNVTTGHLVGVIMEL